MQAERFLRPFITSTGLAAQQKYLFFRLSVKQQAVVQSWLFSCFLAGFRLFWYLVSGRLQLACNLMSFVFHSNAFHAAVKEKPPLGKGKVFRNTKKHRRPSSCLRKRLRTIAGMRRKLLCFLLWCCAPAGLMANQPVFDLIGPKMDVHVKRGNLTLPIGAVPNLQAGDRLWVHPDLPESQSARFVLVVAFLRGVTNPPPAEWFTRVETWSHEVRSEGVFVTVPAEAQQAVLFLAPETGGDFSTLRKAVMSRPGAFVRASQDLLAASLDRMRLEAYLSEVRVTTQTDSRSLKTRAELAARSLGIRLDQQCFDKPSDQQAPCLAEHTDGIVLDDANAGTLVEQWTSGSSRDLMNQISSTTMGGGGAYSPYIGAIVDTARILASLHTAHFQYIPALALPLGDTLNLRLSVPPSFRDPKSVVVVALPPIGQVKPPPLHPVSAADSFCAQKPGVVLPVEGAPMVFATQMANGLVLHLETKKPSPDIPVKLDSSQGGLVLDHPAPALDEAELTGVLRGRWGFDAWEGPRFRFHAAQGGKWTMPAADQSALVVGRDDLLHIVGDSTLCVDHVEMQADGNPPVRLAFKSSQPESLEVTVPLKDAQPGSIALKVYQYGLEKPDALALNSYGEAASLEKMELSAGDKEAILTGTRLDEVASVELGPIQWTPSTLSRVRDADQLTLQAAVSTAGLEPGKKYAAKVLLRDGRSLKVPVIVAPPRPQFVLLNKGVQEDPSLPPAPVHLNSPDDLSVSGKLVFFLKSTSPANFPRSQKVEVAAVDGSFRVLLTLADGLILEDARTVMGSLDTLARFGASAFGPIRLCVINDEGIASEWQPLGTLVRVPTFKELRCPHTPAKACQLSGTNLFLAQAFSASPDFDSPGDLPPDFTGTQFSVPHTANGTLYVKLRDDPQTIQTLTLPVLPMLTLPTPPPAPIQTPPAVPEDATPAAGSPAQNPAAAGANAQSPAVAAPTVPAANATTENPPAAATAPAAQAAKPDAAPAQPKPESKP